MFQAGFTSAAQRIQNRHEIGSARSPEFDVDVYRDSDSDGGTPAAVETRRERQQKRLLAAGGLDRHPPDRPLRKERRDAAAAFRFSHERQQLAVVPLEDAQRLRDGARQDLPTGTAETYDELLRRRPKARSRRQEESPVDLHRHRRHG